MIIKKRAYILFVLLILISLACNNNTTNDILNPTINITLSANTNLGTAPINVLFTADIPNSISTITNYQWDYDGDNIFDKNTIVNTSSYIYSIPNDYVAKVKATDDKGKSYEATTSIKVLSINNVNTKPKANAGADQQAYIGNSVILNGNKSSDADGNDLTYSWTFTVIPENSTSKLSNNTIINPTFIPDLKGTYELSLIVNDGKENSDPDYVSITVLDSAITVNKNIKPVANAGNDQQAFAEELVSLNGNNSIDKDGETLSYSWFFISIPTNSTAKLSNKTLATPTFIPDVKGSYELCLIVNDGKENSEPDYVTITALEPNKPINIPTEGLVAYYPFNGNARDESGNRNNGIVYAATLTSDRFNNENSSYTFDGLKDYINIGTLGNFGSQMNNFTICFWFKNAFNNTPKIRALIKTINNGLNDTLIAIEIHRSALDYSFQNKLMLFDIRGDNGKNLRGHITKDVYDNKWHYIQWRVISAKYNNFEVYVDGEKQTIVWGAKESPTYSNFDNPIIIGGGNNRGLIEGLFYGSLDDIVFFNRSLLDIEIKNIYQNNLNNTF